MRPIIAASLLLLLVPLAGCQHPPPFTFHVVDAESGQPLEGVHFRIPATGNYMDMHAFPADDTEFEGATDAQGYATFPLMIEKGLGYYLFITKPHYEAMTGPLDPVTARCKLVRYPADKLPAFGTPLELPEIHVTPQTPTLIPMHRLP